MPPEVSKGRHIKVPPAGCKGGASRHVKGLSRHILAGAIFFCGSMYFREHPAAVFHVPLDMPSTLFLYVGPVSSFHFGRWFSYHYAIKRKYGKSVFLKVLLVVSKVSSWSALTKCILVKLLPIFTPSSYCRSD